MTINSFQERLLDWYFINARDLPWRKTLDAYKIWLSEIILQQTRVSQGMDYYIKFTKTFPKIEDLANAPEETVLKNWQGLGYYSRARNLHKAAKMVALENEGKFPDNYEDILKLPGVGPYTASAIASFAFNEPKAVVDGNVYRFLSRLHGIRTPIDSTQGIKEFQELANKLLDKKRNATYNQAIMEFGANCCTFKKPNCAECPFVKDCSAKKHDVIALLPIKSKKIKKTTRQLDYLYITNNHGEVLINKRTSKDIWKNMYDLPTSESKENMVAEDKAPIYQTKHLLSHQTLNISIFSADSEANDTDLKEGEEWITRDKISSRPFPKPLVDFFETQGISI